MPKLWTSAYGRALVADFCYFGGSQALIPIIPLYLNSFGASNMTVGVAAGIFMGIALVLGSGPIKSVYDSGLC